jgi:flagellar hook-length control protein FliK
LTITPFGRLEVQVHDLPTAKLQARQPQSRRSVRDRFPEPKPQIRLPEHPESESVPEESGLDAGLHENGKGTTTGARGEGTSPKSQLAEAEASDGSEGALALRPQDEIVLQGKVVDRRQGMRRQAVQDHNPGQLSAGIAGTVPGQALPTQGVNAPSVQPAAAVGAAKAATVRPLNATQNLLQRNQPQKARGAEAAQPTRRQSPIQLAQEDRQSILESVTFALSEGKGEAVLHLNPKELGSLSIRLSMEGKQLSLRLSAERPEVAEALLEDVQKLREMLQEQGLKIHDFDVRTGNPSDHRQEAYEFRRAHQVSPQGRAANGTADAETSSTPSRPKSVRIDGTGIDFIA